MSASIPVLPGYPVDRIRNGRVRAASGTPRSGCGARVCARRSLLASCSAGTPKIVAAPQSGLAQWQLRRTFEMFQSGLAKEPTLSKLAANVGLSAFHFARAFKAATEQPPHRYLIQLRLSKVQELLETTNLTVTEMGAQIGYEDPAHFARLFRKSFRATPAAFRRERRA